jgi:hypothetical protein
VAALFEPRPGYGLGRNRTSRGLNVFWREGEYRLRPKTHGNGLAGVAMHWKSGVARGRILSPIGERFKAPFFDIDHHLLFLLWLIASIEAINRRKRADRPFELENYLI